MSMAAQRWGRIALSAVGLLLLVGGLTPQAPLAGDPNQSDDLQSVKDQIARVLSSEQDLQAVWRQQPNNQKAALSVMTELEAEINSAIRVLDVPASRSLTGPTHRDGGPTTTARSGQLGRAQDAPSGSQVLPPPSLEERWAAQSRTHRPVPMEDSRTEMGLQTRPAAEQLLRLKSALTQVEELKRSLSGQSTDRVNSLLRDLHATLTLPTATP
jgi:hypothetical protein